MTTTRLAPQPDRRANTSRRRANTSRRRAALIAAIAGAVLIVVGVVALVGAGAAQPRQLDWPAVGTAAISQGDDVMLSPGADTPRPIASLAKLVTALVVLDRMPLDPQSPGPAIQITDRDAALVEREQIAGGMTLPVDAGDVVSTRGLLEAMLVASSNNHARSLVTHVFGGEAEYAAAAASWLREHDLVDTTIADATGMSPATRSSAADMLAIARLAAASPTIADVAATAVLSAPGEPAVESTNDLLGTQGIDGLKTGNTDAAGFTIAFTATIDGEPIVGVLLGSPSQAQRATDVTRLIAQLKSR